MVSGTATVDNSTDTPTKIKNISIFLYDLVSPKSRYRKKMKTLFRKDTHTPMLTAASFVIVKIRKKVNYSPMDGWMDKEAAVYVYNGILFWCKEEWNLAMYNIDGRWPFYVTWSKSDRDGQVAHGLPCTWNLGTKAPWYSRQIGGCSGRG